MFYITMQYVNDVDTITLESIEDIKLMVDSFYDKMNQDDLLSPVFNEHAKIDWETHLPKMYNFQDTILFSRGDYKGSP